MKRVKNHGKVIFESEDISHGFGEVRAEYTDEGLQWRLPGGALTSDRQQAEECAMRMDRIIRANVARTGRSLV